MVRAMELHHRWENGAAVLQCELEDRTRSSKDLQNMQVFFISSQPMAAIKAMGKHHCWENGAAVLQFELEDRTHS
jgi:hypothetical protein